MTQKTIDLVLNSRILIGKCWADDMKDILQDAILKLLQNDNKVESLAGAEKKKYILRCIRNSHVDFIRRKKRQPSGVVTLSFNDHENEISNTMAVQPDVYGKIELKEIMEKGQQHKAFPVLFAYVNGYTNKEIAEMTGEKINTILGRCRYARNFLKS